MICATPPRDRIARERTCLQRQIKNLDQFAKTSLPGLRCFQRITHPTFQESLAALAALLLFIRVGVEVGPALKY
eukprot:scaffold1933_cov124-Pinguiococcus_pyrenoidosus.AAC.2